jgi:hypothetical protein
MVEARVSFRAFALSGHRAPQRKKRRPWPGLFAEATDSADGTDTPGRNIREIRVIRGLNGLPRTTLLRVAPLFHISSTVSHAGKRREKPFAPADAGLG